MGVDDVQSAIAAVARQNRQALLSISSGRGQVTGTYEGVQYVLGVRGGHIGQFFPLPHWGRHVPPGFLRGIAPDRLRASSYGDPDHLVGAVVMTVQGRPVLTAELLDDVDDLRAYLLTACERCRASGVAET